MNVNKWFAFGLASLLFVACCGGSKQTSITTCTAPQAGSAAVPAVQSRLVSRAAKSGNDASAGLTYNGITLTGMLIWHSYNAYGFTGVQSWMANFDTGIVYEITPSRISGAMNYDFSPDGAEVVVMGSDNNACVQQWDLWVAQVTSTGLTNITKITDGSTDGSRNEDPKFSSDGTEIIFKKNYNYIVSIKTSDVTVNGEDQTPSQTTLLGDTYESSMPYYLVGSDVNFVFTDDADTTNSTIQYYNGETVSTLYMPPAGEHAYYPIALNSTQFYFAQSDSAGHDQIVLGDTSGDPAVSAAFDTANYECADPFPLDPNWVAYASTRPGSVGVYDIWVGNFTTGETYDLDSWISGANYTNSNLGPTFFGTISPDDRAIRKTATASTWLSGPATSRR